MAVENADLVETSFLLDYLNAIKVEKRWRLASGKTDSFVDMFRAKCKDESVGEYVCDHMVMSQSAINVSNAYAVPELDALLLRKWTDGDSCVTAHL